MTMSMITVQLDKDAARIYTKAPQTDKEKLNLLFSMWIKEYGDPEISLPDVMDEISDKAQARGLTPEILESLLNDD
ncbi:MAG: hypothetical protein IAF02_16560 [Anaerolineae bacterium]|nr:hypothetical protein [Anaerolineae bacterium]